MHERIKVIAGADGRLTMLADAGTGLAFAVYTGPNAEDQAARAVLVHEVCRAVDTAEIGTVIDDGGLAALLDREETRLRAAAAEAVVDVHVFDSAPPSLEGFQAALQRLERAHGHFTATMSFGAIITIVGHVQLALRHPANRGTAARHARNVIDAIIATLESAEPEIGALLRAGYDPAHDQPAGTGPLDQGVLTESPAIDTDPTPTEAEIAEALRFGKEL